MSFNPNCVKGKVVFVTGGATGICKGITEVYLRHGAVAMIASRKEENLKKAVADLTSRVGGRVEYAVMDVRKNESVEAAIQKCIDVYGRIDILINGAAGNFLVPSHRMSVNAFKTVIDIDTVGTFAVSRAAFNLWFGQPSKADASKPNGGVILNISATLHYAGTLLQAHAGAAKAAVDALTKHFACEWGPFGVRVNGIAPGPIEGTEGMDRLDPHKNQDAVVSGSTKNKKGDSSNDNASLTSYIPVQRMGTKQDIGHMCMFLSLPEASYVTGQTIVVDGGQILTVPNFTVVAPQIHKVWREAKM